LGGRVYVPSEADTVPLVNHWVVMHQVTMQGGEAVDSGRTDQFGVYQLRAPERDTAAVYLASVTYSGIAYFSTAVHARGITTDTAATLFVYDTSSVAPPVETAQRQIVVRAQESNGARPVLELILLRNRGTLTRVTSDTARPAWQSAIPPGAVDFQVGDSEMSAAAVYRRGDSVAALAPIEPGEKRIIYSYVLPPGESLVSFPIDQAVGRLQLLVEDTTATLEEGPIAYVGVESVEQLRFANFEGLTVPAGATVTLRLSNRPFVVEGIMPFVMIVAALAMLAVLWWWWRRVPAAALVADDAEILASQIAQLDDAFEAHRDSATAGEREAYARRRAELKARLTAALARHGSHG
jgi:hypothetical protein